MPEQELSTCPICKYYLPEHAWWCQRIGTTVFTVPTKEADTKPSNNMRQFATGATRDSDEGKNDYEGFLSPLVLEAYGDYMTEHRVQSDGSLRDSDNWQKGISTEAYAKSLIRHVFDFWKLHRGWKVKPELRGGTLQTPTKKTLLCAILFNTMGYLFELLKEETQ
jgi:hypothetical protein